ncbi:hypothetical protein OUY22_30780 [Nonomuraea sp. MCN248]|uniref:Uncharacterized protein n=1 Tax=Nonomuraea corallina TaxID=2989783 RepID=A0ABT4SKR8_9ACTN|nr:hypothetical protein [Nonomuraea corallina]MDA0637817.1 hypothetical protein [Nonomuraea corallina]
MNRAWMVAGVLALVAAPAVPVAAAGVAMVLERVDDPAGMLRWMRTGDVLRYEVRLSGMAGNARLAVAATPVHSLTELSCAPDFSARSPDTPDLGGAELTARALASRALDGVSVPGAGTCRLGDVSSGRSVRVVLSVPPGAEEVRVAAVARLREADGGLTTITRTATTPVNGDAEAGPDSPEPEYGSAHDEAWDAGSGAEASPDRVRARAREGEEHASGLPRHAAQPQDRSAATGWAERGGAGEDAWGSGRPEPGATGGGEGGRGRGDRGEAGQPDSETAGREESEGPGWDESGGSAGRDPGAAARRGADGVGKRDSGWSGWGEGDKNGRRGEEGGGRRGADGSTHGGAQGKGGAGARNAWEERALEYLPDEPVREGVGQAHPFGEVKLPEAVPPPQVAQGAPLPRKVEGAQVRVRAEKRADPLSGAAGLPYAAAAVGVLCAALWGVAYAQTRRARRKVW